MGLYGIYRGGVCNQRRSRNLGGPSRPATAETELYLGRIQRLPGRAQRKRSADEAQGSRRFFDEVSGFCFDVVYRRGLLSDLLCPEELPQDDRIRRQDIGPAGSGEAGTDRYAAGGLGVSLAGHALRFRRKGFANTRFLHESEGGVGTGIANLEPMAETARPDGRAIREH